MHFSVKLKTKVVPCINNTFEKWIIKISTPKTNWKDRGRPIKNIAKKKIERYVKDMWYGVFKGN